jgi:hypothetical protein
MHALRRAIHARARQDPESARRDRATLAEVIRLGHFTRDYYASATLALEHIAESLQQTRLALLRKGWREALHGVVPVAVAPRVASIRVAEPIAVREWFVASTEETDVEAVVLATLRERLQIALDRLNAEFATQSDAYRRPNPFYVRG